MELVTPCNCPTGLLCNSKCSYLTSGLSIVELLTNSYNLSRSEVVVAVVVVVVVVARGCSRLPHQLPKPVKKYGTLPECKEAEAVNKSQVLVKWLVKYNHKIITSYLHSKVQRELKSQD